MGSRQLSLFVTFLLIATGLWSQDLTSLSFEEFLNIQVSSLNKTPQKLSRTPAAVFVISQEDIRRSGATMLPEALRLAPGIHVARITGVTWAVGIRGFNNIYSNKLLVMIDGRTIYNPLLSGVLWNENYVMLEDVDHIEVIRGPGATMWGANAVSGVINIITKSAKATQGGLLGISGGAVSPVSTRARYGHQLGNKGAWRTWGSYSLQGQTRSPAGTTLNPWPDAAGGIRFELDPTPADSILVEAQIHRSRSDVEQGIVSDAAPIKTGSGSTNGFVMGRWEHINKRGDTTSLQAYNSFDSLDGGTFQAEIDTLDADIHHLVKLPAGHSVIIGGGARTDRISTTGTTNFYFVPAKANYQIVNGYVSDDWSILPDRLSVEAGIKVESFSKAGTAFEPTARIMLTPTARIGLWASASRAVRTPAHTDYALRLPMVLPGVPVSVLLAGNDQFRPEVLNAYEAGVRIQAHRSVGMDVSIFRHAYRGLYGYTLPFSVDPSMTPGLLGALPPGLTIPAVTTNAFDGLNRGGEATVRYDIRPGWQVSGWYSYLVTGTTYRRGVNAFNSFGIPNYTPKHQWQARMSKDIARRWSADMALRGYGELGGGALAGYTQLDCRLARRLGEFTEFSVTGTNLLRPYQQEFTGQFLYQAGYVRRSIEAGVRWSF